MKRLLCVTLAVLGLGLAPPAAAQDDTGVKAEREQAVMSALAGVFSAEPLTPQQEARLPQARALVDAIMPPGTMNEMMGGMFDKIMGPVMELAGQPNSATVAEELGLDPDALDLDEQQAAAAMAIVDPAWKERRKLISSVMQETMSKAMTTMEPAMRVGVAEAYAVHFTDAELRDIGAFFATPSGATYARKSYMLAADPRIMAATMKALPSFMEQMSGIEAKIKEATEALPPRRSFEDLTPAMRAELTELTGVSADEIEEGVANRAEQNPLVADDDI